MRPTPDWRSRLAIACFVAVAVGTAIGLLAVIYRAAYGQWPPAAPDRVEWCGRRYYGSTDVSPRGPAMPVRSIGRHPPVVGTPFYAPTNRLAPEACALVIYRKGSAGWYAYGLSGSP